MPVTHVHQRSDGVTLTTPSGAIEAKAAIVTASTNVLAAGAIRFANGPAKDLLDQIVDVPCGSYEKIAIAFDRSPFGDFGNEYVMIMDDAGGYPINFQLNHCGAPLAMGEIGGSRAREMSEAGDCAMIDFALERLVQGFGSDLRKRVIATAVTHWAANPFTRGAYSYARVGTGHRRRAMIETDTGSVVFAGEAFSQRWQATAHGAFTSGSEVARRLVQAGKVRVGS
jgi:monoamine oxidase